MDMITVTILNQDNGNYLPSVLKTCYVHFQKREGESSATIRVMDRGKPFAPPELWRNMPMTEKAKYWTVQENDICAIGEVGSASPKELRERGYTVISLNSFTDNRRGLDIQRHIRIEGA